MAKEPKVAAKKAVRMKCVMNGAEPPINPGDEIIIDAEEADRLIGLGAAEAVGD
jgi:hypothetical protein